MSSLFSSPAEVADNKITCEIAAHAGSDSAKYGCESATCALAVLLAFVQWQIHCKRLVKRKHEQHRQARAQRRRRARWTGPGACRARLFEYARRRAAGTSRNMRTRTGQPPPCCLLRDFLRRGRYYPPNSGVEVKSETICMQLRHSTLTVNSFMNRPYLGR